MLGRGPVASEWALQCGLLAPVSGKVIRQARNRSLIRRDVTAAEIIAVAAERWMRGAGGAVGASAGGALQLAAVTRDPA